MHLPLAFLILVQVLLASLGWAANLHLLSRAGINVRPILQLSSPPLNPHKNSSGSNSDARSLYTGVYRLTAFLGAIALLGWTLCAHCSAPWQEGLVTLMTYAAIAAVLVLPRRVLWHTTRLQFGRVLIRILNPSLAAKVFLSDIIMADIMTSCSRVFSDLSAAACELVVRAWALLFGKTAYTSADAEIQFLVDAVQARRRASGHVPLYVGTVAAALPYALRLRQCVSEYLRSPAGSGDSRRHAANAVKYASSFPVIFLSSAQSQAYLIGTNTKDWEFRFMVVLWAVFAAINSVYSLYWDIAFDWDLGHGERGGRLADLVVGAGSGGEGHKGAHSGEPARASLEPHYHRNSGHRRRCLLRPYLCFERRWVYYLAMVVDVLLRGIWVLKLSSLRVNEIAYSGFWLGVLEIFRRWVWTFIRVEKEAAGAHVDSIV